MEIQTNTDTANSNGEELRKCNSCGCKKLLKVHFSVRKNTNEYYKSCNNCVERSKESRKKNKEYQKQYRQEHKEEILIYRKQYNKQYRQDNKEAILIKQKQWREENKEAILIKQKQYYQENKEAMTTYKKQYRKDKRHHCEHNTPKHACKICSPLGHLKHLASSHIHNALNNHNGKNDRTLNYLCCTIEEYRDHLERQFTPEMTWDNMGDYWQIDHIIPVLYKVDGQSPTEADVIERLKYTNTQPMLAEHNLSKGNRYIGAYQPDF